MGPDKAGRVQLDVSSGSGVSGDGRDDRGSQVCTTTLSTLAIQHLSVRASVSPRLNFFNFFSVDLD